MKIRKNIPLTQDDKHNILNIIKKGNYDEYTIDGMNNMLFFRELLTPVTINSYHVGLFDSGFGRAEFKAVVRSLRIVVTKEENIQNDIDDSIITYSARVTLIGGIAYKYSRNQDLALADDTEIFNKIVEASDVETLIKEVIAVGISFKEKLKG